MVVFTAGYLAWSALKIAHHQMWRDELQPWSLARSSSSLGQLISRVRYEQHSPGWYVLLWVVSRFTSSPEAVQVLLFVLVVVTVIYVVWVAAVSDSVEILLALRLFPPLRVFDDW